MIQVWMLAIIGILLLVSIPMSSFYLQRKQYKKNDWTYFSGKGKQDSTLYAFYAFFSEWRLSRHFIDKLKRHVDKYYPGQDKEAACKTMKIYFFEVGTGMVIFLLILVLRVGLIASVGLLALVYFINTGYVHKENERMDQFFLEDLIKVVLKIRHTYQSAGTIKEAMEAALDEETPESMKVHLKYLISVLEEEDMEESVKKYIDNVPNDYMKEFMALCVTIEQFGDPKVGNGLSQFLTRISNLRMRMENEIRSRKMKQHLFYGFMFIIAFPLYILSPIRSWGEYSLPILDKYYSGSYGVWVCVLSFVLVLVFFQINIRLQENFHILEKNHVILFRLCEMGRVHEWLNQVLAKNEGRKRRTEQLLSSAAETMTVEQLLLKRILYGVTTFFIANLVFIGIHSNQKNYSINHINDLGSISSSISEKEEVVLRQTMGKILQAHAGEKMTKELMDTMQKEISDKYSEPIKVAVMEQMVNRLNRYNAEYYRWYELFVSIGIAILGFFFPLWVVTYESRIVKASQMTEVMQMQSILSILVPITQMTPEIMLSWMERFAVIFRPVVRRCMDSLSSEEEMETLLESVSFEPMKRMLENLKASDCCGIPKAFDELEAEHTAYQEDKKQEDMLQLDDKSAMGKYMATIPFAFVLIAYLFIPFTIETMILFINQI